MSRKYNNDEMEKIGKAVEEWESRKDPLRKSDFWNNLFKFNDPDQSALNQSVLEASREIGFLPEEISRWYVEHWLENINGCGSI